MGDLLLRRDFGLCACGCGALPPVATYHHRGKGIRKGMRLSVVPGHQGRLPEKSKPQLPDGNPGGTCRCGCGQPTSTYRYGSRRGTHLDFVQGHSQKWKAQQRALRRPQGRRLCTTCYVDRPALAFLDNSGTCLVCLAKRKRAEPIWCDIDERTQQAAKGRAERGRQNAARAIANGTFKRGPEVTLTKRKPS